MKKFILIVLACSINARAEIFQGDFSDVRNLPKKYQILAAECASLYKSKYTSFEIIGQLEESEKKIEFAITFRNSILHGSKLYINLINKSKNRFNEFVAMSMPCYFSGMDYNIRRPGFAFEIK